MKVAASGSSTPDAARGRGRLHQLADETGGRRLRPADQLGLGLGQPEPQAGQAPVDTRRR